MTHEQAQRAASVALDDSLPVEVAAALDAHLASCAACRDFVEGTHALRQHLRLQPATSVPDISTPVLDRLRQQGTARPSAPRRTLFLQAAAVFAVSVLAGSLLVGLNGPAPVQAAGIGERLFAAQTRVKTARADLAVVERGWHPDVRVRTYSGALRYTAPESMVLRLRDRTRYPSASWRPNHVDVVASRDAVSRRFLRPCPIALQPACAAAAEREEVVRGRAPFDAAAPAVSDLVLPVASFPSGSDTTPLGVRTVDGRTAVGVRVTAAQMEPFLRALLDTGTWREVHPSDTVEVWFDDTSMIPVLVRVRAAGGIARARWAASHGYTDATDAEILRVTLSDLRVNAPAAALPPVSPAAETTDDGFRDRGRADLVMPLPAYVPAGMQPYRFGIQGGQQVATWFDGRAWLKVQATSSWRGQRLFGDVGEVVRAVPVQGAGLVYVGNGGQAVSVHAKDWDVAVTGSVGEAELVRVAKSLGINGVAVPGAWDEAATGSVADAETAIPGLLLPGRVEGFDAPAIRVTDHAVSIVYVGPGARGFVLTQARGTALTPPLAADPLGVLVRGSEGRYTPGRGDLEWVEDGLVVSIRSETLAVAELLTIAESLEPPR